MIRLITLVLILAVSCTKPLEIELMESQPKLVINGLINPDENVNVNISTTASITDTNWYFINDASIELFEDNIFIGNLDFISKGSYQINYKPRRNAQYTLKLSNINYNDVYAIDTIPTQVSISSCYFTFPVGLNEDGSPYYEATIIFKDPKDQINYYELIFFKSNTGDSKSYIHEITTNDLSIINEGNTDYYPATLFFTDELFNGNTHELKVRYTNGYTLNTDGSYYPVSNSYVTLRSISRSYYLYRKYWTRHLFNQTIEEDLIGTFMKGETIEMYSNIHNGYGIFAGYCEDTKELKLISH